MKQIYSVAKLILATKVNTLPTVYKLFIQKIDVTNYNAIYIMNKIKNWTIKKKLLAVESTTDSAYKIKVNLFYESSEVYMMEKE